MSAVLYYEPRSMPLNTSGVTMPGCYLQFYLTGTTTPTPIYASSTLTTQLSNPLYSDSTGRFAAVYLNPAVTYRVQLFDQYGNKLEDTDPLAFVPVPQSNGQWVFNSGQYYTLSANLPSGTLYASVQNTASGNVSSAFQASTVTPNSYVNLNQADNSGAPTTNLSVGSAVDTVTFNFPNLYIQNVAATTGIDIRARGVDWIKYTTAQQTFTNNTLTTDAYLVFSNVNPGFYRVHGFAQIAQVSGASSPGMQMSITCLGGLSGPNFISINGQVNNAAFTSLYLANSTIQLRPIASGTTTGADFIIWDGILNITSVGNVEVQWSQYSTDGTHAVIINSGAWVAIEQLS